MAAPGGVCERVTWLPCGTLSRCHPTVGLVIAGPEEDDDHDRRRRGCGTPVRRVELDVSGMTCAACANTGADPAQQTRRCPRVGELRHQGRHCRRAGGHVAERSVRRGRAVGLSGATAGARRRGTTRPRRSGRPLAAAAACGGCGVVRAAVAPVGDVRRPARNPVHRLAVAAHRAGVAHRHLGGVAVPPRRLAQRPPRHGLDGDPDLGRGHRGHAVVAVHDLRRAPGTSHDRVCGRR